MLRIMSKCISRHLFRYGRFALLFVFARSLRNSKPTEKVRKSASLSNGMLESKCLSIYFPGRNCCFIEGGSYKKNKILANLPSRHEREHTSLDYDET